MAGIRQSYILKQLQSDPSQLIHMVCINNPVAVEENLRSKYGIAVTRDDYEHLANQVIRVMQSSPQNAKSIMMDILSVGIDPNNVTPEGQDVLLDLIINNQK